MSTELLDEGVKDAGAGQAGQDDQGNTNDELTNSQAKKLPWVQQMAKDLADLRKGNDERQAQEEKSKREAEIENAKKAENFDEALRLLKEEAASEKENAKAAKKEATFSKIQAALLAAGGKGSKGLYKVAAAEYDPVKHESIDAFVEEFKADAEYSMFFAQPDNQQDNRQVHQQQGKLPATKGQGVNWEQVKAWENSSDKKERAEARRLLGEYRKQHGKYPYRIES